MKRKDYLAYMKEYNREYKAGKRKKEKEFIGATDFTGYLHNHPGNIMKFGLLPKAIYEVKHVNFVVYKCVTTIHPENIMINKLKTMFQNYQYSSLSIWKDGVCIVKNFIDNDA